MRKPLAVFVALLLLASCTPPDGAKAPNSGQSECHLNSDGSQTCGYNCKLGSDGHFGCAQTPSGACALGSDGHVTCGG
jgi:Prokaryotic membrane lipoprotein lipid attachment site